MNQIKNEENLNIEQIVSQILEKIKALSPAQGGVDADVLIANSKAQSVSIRNNELESNELAESSHLGLRVLIQGKQAIFCTTMHNGLNIDDFVNRAITAAKSSPADQHLRIARPDELKQVARNLDLNNYDPSVETITTQELQESAFQIESIGLANPKITNSEGAAVSASSSESILATSNGFFYRNRSSGFAKSLSLIAGKAEDMQSSYDYSYKTHIADLKTNEQIANNAISKTIAKLNPISIKTAQMPVIFARDGQARQLLKILASAVNGSSIVRGNSFLKDKMHSQILPQNVSIIDDPLLPKGFGSSEFDDEGFLSERKYIIKDGQLVNWFLDLRTASVLGLKNNASASRGFSSPPSPASSNLYVDNLAKIAIPLKDMISGIKRGLLVTETFGMGVNSTTGDYSLGAFGFLIEEGEITHPVSEITIASNLLDMFKDIMFADDFNLNDMQSSIDSPSILIHNMTVAGSK